MQRLLSGSLIVCALALALPAAAQVEHPPVPVEKAAYHWPVFGLGLTLGDFYWQEPGTTRGIRNIGTTRIEIAEFELK